MQNLKKITSIEDLIKFLETKGNNHKYYYHYTSWDSFAKIYNSRSFLLTKGNSLIINDQHEAKMKGSLDIWNKTYIGSFAYGSSENMAMWGLYGLPAQDAIRITIPSKAMLNWIDKISWIYLWDNGRKDSICDIKKSLTDIVYINGRRGNNEFKLSCGYDYVNMKNDLGFKNIDINPMMTGYIKNYAWKYEDEVRLKIELPQKYNYEKILVDIPEDTIKSFSITTGPNFQYKNDELYGQLKSEGRIKKSGFNGLLRYRELCSMCKYQHFIKKSKD